MEHPEPKRGKFGFTLQSLKDRVWKEGDQRNGNGHLPKLMDRTTVTAVMSQFGPELSFQGVEPNSVDKEPLHGLHPALVWAWQPWEK